MILFAKIIVAWLIINALILAVRTLCAYRTAPSSPEIREGRRLR
ncbi:hypothetical protein [Azospirillum sp.]|nr:hypothetical protein [Azospirillum sp.]HYD66132.1 hypothetical protein [Azospirillum sp.]